jgi:site-specific recombinase XerC
VGDRDRIAAWGLWNAPLRRTKASIIYQQTGNLRAVQILLGHTKIESAISVSGLR